MCRICMGSQRQSGKEGGCRIGRGSTGSTGRVSGPGGVPACRGAGIEIAWPGLRG